MAPPTVQNLTTNDGSIGGTYGYNDSLLVREEDPSGVGEIVRPVGIEGVGEGESLLAETPSDEIPTEKQLSATRSLRREGVRIFREPQSGHLIARHSIFTDRCLPGEEKPYNIFPMSEDEARALAYFSEPKKMAYDDLWCETSIPGVEALGSERELVTPWDLRDGGQLAALEAAVVNLQRAGEEGTNDRLGRQLAQKVSKERIEEMLAEIERQKGAYQKLAEMAAKFTDQPLPVQVAVGAGATAGVAAVFHYTGKALTWVDSRVGRFIKGKTGPVGGVVMAVVAAAGATLAAGEAQAAPVKESGPAATFTESLIESLFCSVSFGFLCSSEAY